MELKSYKINIEIEQKASAMNMTVNQYINYLVNLGYVAEQTAHNLEMASAQIFTLNERIDCLFEMMKFLNIDQSKHFSELSKLIARKQS